MKRSIQYTFEQLMERLNSPLYCVMEFSNGYAFVRVIHRDYGKKQDGK